MEIIRLEHTQHSCLRQDFGRQVGRFLIYGVLSALFLAMFFAMPQFALAQGAGNALDFARQILCEVNGKEGLCHELPQNKIHPKKRMKFEDYLFIGVSVLTMIGVIIAFVKI